MTTINYKFLLLTLIYAAGIMWFSFQPDYSTEAQASGLRQMVMNFLHIPAYAGLAGLMVLTFGVWKIEDRVEKIEDRAEKREDRKEKMEDRHEKVENRLSGLDFKVFLSSIFYSPFSLIFLIATGYGIVNEFIQAGVPGRSFSIGDMVRNALGAMIGIWVVGNLQKKRKLL